MIKHVLSNGLRIVLEKIPACRSVSLGIWVKTGSRSENESNNGISHLIEHMLFKGTRKYSAREIAERFDSIGGYVNAFTAKEYTCYYAKILDQHVPLALDILSEMYFHSLLRQEDLNKEKKVIYEEISMYEDTPDDLVHDLIAEAAFGDHSLGYSILGTEDILESLQPDDLRTFMQHHYHVDNTVISIAGNIQDDIIPLLEKYFGQFDNRQPFIPLEPPVFLGKQIFQYKQTEQNHICLALPGCTIDDERIYAMALLNNLIGGGMSSRLFQEVREERGLAYSIYSYHSAHADSGLFTIYAGTAPKQTEEVLKVTLGVLEQIVECKISEAELNKGKEQLKGSLILSSESTSSRMNRLGKNELMLGKHYTIDEVIANIDSVELEHIRSLTEEIFAHPFAMAMIGQSDEALSKVRGDHLANHRRNQTNTRE